MAVIEAIATTYLEADASSVTFSSIPATYEHLQLRISARQSTALVGSYIKAQFNSDTGSNYTYHYMGAGGSSSFAGGATSQTANVWFRLSAGNNAATAYGAIIVDILDYANTNKNTTCQVIGANSAQTDQLYFNSTLWDDTSAVSTILLAPAANNFVRGSVFSLYGLKSS